MGGGGGGGVEFVCVDVDAVLWVGEGVRVCQVLRLYTGRCFEEWEANKRRSAMEKEKN